MDLKLDSFIVDKTLLFTVTSDGYKYYTWNLWKYIQTLKVSWKLCILCLDRQSYDFFNRIAMIPARLYLMEGPPLEHKSPALYGTTPFKRMNRMKLLALQTLTQRIDIETLVFLDSDIALFRDFTTDIKIRLQEHPLWFQCDEKQENQFICSDETHCSNPCTGVILMRLDERTRSQFHDFYSIVADVWKNAITDQDYIHVRLKQTGISYKTLPRHEYPNGIFLANDRYKEGNPYLLHFNYFVGSDKKRVMKIKGCWLLDV